MKNTVFRGVATAMITPLCDGKIDYGALERLFEIQIECGVDALVIAGTTGECSTLSEEERVSLFEFSARMARGRIPLILGTGSNSTATAVKYAKIAERIGGCAYLSVTPYYNKGTERGIISHYLEIARATEMPIILYNVPSRTGVNLSLAAIEELAECESIVGIKEAQDSIDRLTALSALSDKIALYSGNDSQIYPTLALGGAGVISVVSNVMPRAVLGITRAYFSGDVRLSYERQISLLPFAAAMFLETNPTPIKHAMKLSGLCDDEVRLPLTRPSEDTMRKIKEALDKHRDLL